MSGERYRLTWASSLGFSVKFFFQPIYTDYANKAYFDIRSHLNLLFWNRWTKLNQIWLGGSLSNLCLDSPALHSRWLLLLKIEISSIVHCCFIIPSPTKLRRDIVMLPSILVTTRINILQWILTKLGTYLVLKKIWNPIDFQGHSVKFLPRNILVNTL